MAHCTRPAFGRYHGTAVNAGFPDKTKNNG
jgi:hypothetical protein